MAEDDEIMGTGYLISYGAMMMLLSLFRVSRIKSISKFVDYSIAIYFNVNYV